MSKITCTVIGDAMVDILFPLSNRNDLEYMTHGGVTSTVSKTVLGGTLNVAVNIVKLGLPSAFIGKIGDGCFGKFIKDDLNKNNVRSKLAITKSLKTGIVVVLILPNKERFFIVDRGANSDLKEEDVDFDTCLNSQYLYMSGYSFQDATTSRTLLKVIQEVSKINVGIVFNPASPNLSKRYKEKFMDLIKNYVDVLILNEKEGYELVGCNGENGVQELLSHNLKVVAWTMGEKGSIMATPQEIRKFNAYPVDVVDTTGAGDMYAASVIVGLAKGWDIKRIGSHASRSASMIVKKVGARI